MGEKRQKSDDKKAPKSGGKRAAIRQLARARQKAMYAAHFDRVEPNRKRKMRRHLRRNPFDGQASELFRGVFTNPDMLGVNSKGRKLVKRRERAILLLARAQHVPTVPAGPASELHVADQ